MRARARGGHSPRIQAMTPVGRVLTERQDGMAGLLLGEARRLFATVVGPGLAAGAEVAAVRGFALVLAVRSEGDLRQLQSIEGFLLRTLNERLTHVKLRRVEYVLDRAAGSVRRMEMPAAAVCVVPDEATRATIDEMTSRIGDPLLRERLGAWMGAVLCQSKTLGEGAHA